MPNTGANQVNLNIAGADSYFGTNVLVIKDIPTASFSKTGIVNYFSLTDFTVDEHDITLFTNSERNDFYILKTGRGIYDSDRRLTESDLFHVKVSLNDFTNALKSRLEELDTLFRGITPTNVSNWNDTYLRSAVDNLILQAKNDVIATILNNPDADINSIQELNNLISNNLTQLSTKLSFQDAQNLTQAQKQQLLQNAGLENIIQSDPNGDETEVFNARGNLVTLPAAGSTGITQADIVSNNLIQSDPNGDETKVFNARGQAISLYYPTFQVHAVTPLNLSDTSNTITINGIHLDTVSVVRLDASVNDAGTSVTILSQSPTQLICTVVINSINQNYELKLINAQGVVFLAKNYQTPNVITITPKLNSLVDNEKWYVPGITGNAANVSDGVYTTGNSDGWNDWAYFGKLQATQSIEISFTRTVNYLTTPEGRILISETATNNISASGCSIDINSTLIGTLTDSSYLTYMNLSNTTNDLVIKITITPSNFFVNVFNTNGLLCGSKQIAKVMNISSGVYVNFIGKTASFGAQNITAKTVN